MIYPFADVPDEDLARAARGGDEIARDRLLDEYKDVLFTCVVRLTGDRELAETALVRGFVRWFRGLGGKKPPHGIRGAMYRLALDVARDACKGRRPDVSCSPKAAAEQAEELKACGASVGQADRPSQLQWVLAAVPTRSREVLVLIDVMGLTDEQAAFLLGIKPAEFPAVLSRATQEFLKTYQAYGPRPDPRTATDGPKLRKELRGMGWESAPWHFAVSVRQALRDRRQQARGRSRTLLILGVVLVAALIILWLVL
ncbi:MAG: polymerase sigma factor [Bacteroidetes bacterium]|jgi:RNA polymerase sigma-70 factor (ECF subfamily)|nr:polymerase sigma factor [Bacteroidota bacterium]